MGEMEERKEKKRKERKRKKEERGKEREKGNFRVCFGFQNSILYFFRFFITIFHFFFIILIVFLIFNKYDAKNEFSSHYFKLTDLNIKI